MKTSDVIEYAKAVVGFPIEVGQLILINAECCGRDQNDNIQSNDLGAKAEIKSIRMRDYPYQLTVDVDIFVGGTRSRFHQSFTENDPDPQFPFLKIKTAEELLAEAQAAEAAERKAKEDAEKKEKEEEDRKARSEANRHRVIPAADPNSVQEDYHQHYYGYH